MEAKIIIPKHGHVTPRADGTKARCGGPTLGCAVCRAEQRAIGADRPPATSIVFDPAKEVKPFRWTLDQAREVILKEEEKVRAQIDSMRRAGYKLLGPAEFINDGSGRYLLRWVKVTPATRPDGTPKPHMRKIGGWWFCYLKGTSETCALDAHKAYSLWCFRNGMVE